jgi:hypothetical protein
MNSSTQVHQSDTGFDLDLVGSNQPTESGWFPGVGPLKFPMISDRQNLIFIPAVG